MVGVAETEEEITQIALDLLVAGVDVLTIGLSSTEHLSVVEYMPPEKDTTERMGFKYLAAGPLVKRSYRAGEFILEKVIQPSLPERRV
jgi:lipoyl synthase